MKSIFATTALVFALASPVMAQDYQAWDSPMTGPSARSWQDPAQAYALSGGVIVRPHSPNPAWDVYGSTGEYLGSDPDPLVRGQLSMDPPGSGD